MNPRHLTRVLMALVLAATVVLTSGSIALAKEGIKARLTVPLNTDASPGEKITVTWTLSMTDDQGNEHPFNAIGVFVRLESASAGTPTMGFASAAAHPDGRYTALVAVPRGGIGAVHIGLRGSTDIIFPLVSDPVAMRANAAVTARKKATPIDWTMIVVALVPLVAAFVLSWMLGAAQLRRQM